MLIKQNLAFKNVTISGLPGAGSTTLLAMLKEALPDWQGFSGGEFMRLYATEQGLFDGNNTLHHSSLVYGDDFDKKVDFGSLAVWFYGSRGARGAESIACLQ